MRNILADRPGLKIVSQKLKVKYVPNPELEILLVGDSVINCRCVCVDVSKEQLIR